MSFRSLQTTEKLESYIRYFIILAKSRESFGIRVIGRREVLALANVATHQESVIDKYMSLKNFGMFGESSKLSDRREEIERPVIWSSEQAHLVDALAAEGDEGRGNLR